jgi:hypothetical protein
LHASVLVLDDQLTTGTRDILAFLLSDCARYLEVIPQNLVELLNLHGQQSPSNRNITITASWNDQFVQTRAHTPQTPQNFWEAGAYSGATVSGI